MFSLLFPATALFVIAVMTIWHYGVNVSVFTPLTRVLTGVSHVGSLTGLALVGLVKEWRAMGFILLILMLMLNLYFSESPRGDEKKIREFGLFGRKLKKDMVTYHVVHCVAALFFVLSFQFLGSLIDR